MTLSDGGGPLWPSLIFCYITQQKVALTPKTCSQIKFLIFRHPFTPLFQHSRESFPPFMSINVDQHLDIETLKIRKTSKGLPFGNEKKIVSDFDEIQNMQSLWPKDFTKKNWVESETKIFFRFKGGTLWLFFENQKNTKGSPLWKKNFFVSDFTQILCVRSWDHKDFRFWVSSKKIFFWFFPFSPNARGPPKIFDVRFFKFFCKKCRK